MALEQVTKERDEARAEVEKLHSLLSRAAHAIHDGFIGGEWASTVFQQDELCWGVSNEADRAEDVLREIWTVQGKHYRSTGGYYWRDNWNRTPPSPVPPSAESVMADVEVEDVRRRWAAVPEWLPWLDSKGVFFAKPIAGGANPAEVQWRLTSPGYTANPRIPWRLETTWEAYRHAAADIATLLAKVDALRDKP